MVVVQPAVTRYSSSPCLRYLRVELADGTTTAGLIRPSGEIDWLYSPCDDEVARECAASAGDWTIDGVEYMGEESREEMDRAVCPWLAEMEAA